MARRRGSRDCHRQLLGEGRLLQPSGREAGARIPGFYGRASPDFSEGGGGGDSPNHELDGSAAPPPPPTGREIGRAHV